jgi:peroxiredoxin
MGKEKIGAVNYVDAALASLTAGESVSNPKTKPYGCNVKYKKAAGFNLKSFDGKGVKLSELEGKIVVLEWFNDECPFVKYHYEKKTTMLDLAKKYKDQKVVWLAINSTSHATDQQTTDFSQKHNLVYPVLDDRPGKVGMAYGAKTTPHIFIVDTKGNVVYNGGIDNSPMGKTAEGVVSVNYVDKALSEVLAGKGISTPATRPYGCNVKYPKKAKAAALK